MTATEALRKMGLEGQEQTTTVKSKGRNALLIASRSIPDNAEQIKGVNCVVYLYKYKNQYHGKLPAACGFIGNAAKAAFRHFFRSEEQRQAFINEFLSNNAHREEEKNKRQVKRIEENREAVTGVNVGDIFHYSWGYDQTNCEFYQVVEKKGAYVFVREIAQRSVPGSEGFMCDRRTAVKDSFISTTVLKKLVTIYGLSFPHGSCRKWDGESKYCSWYA